MKLTKIETGNLKLDGGAMFGVVPKTLWSRYNQPDENNLVNLCMRCLLIETENRKILIDSGLGTKQDSKFLQYYYLNGEDTLENSLKEANVGYNEITDLIITHLHFDHCGGMLTRTNSNEIIPTFPNANYWCSKPQWNSALNPNRREKASYLTNNILPLKDSGKLRLFDNRFTILPEIEIRLFFGHTTGLSVPFINFGDKTLVYVSDLVPVAGNIPVTWVPAYDIHPLLSISEKESFLNVAVDNNYYLFFEHDINIECCNLKQSERGVVINKTFKLSDL